MSCLLQISQLIVQNIAIFVASGNYGSSTGLNSPACLDRVISVGATYAQDYNALECIAYGCDGFKKLDGDYCSDLPDIDMGEVVCVTNSNHTLDVLAPGAAISSTCLNGGYCTWSGTSEAAPYAAGVAALMLQANECLTPIEIETLLKTSGDLVFDTRNLLQLPLINAARAVELAREVPCYGSIAFAGYDISHESRDIYIYNEQSGVARNLTPDSPDSDDFYPILSPDGTKIAYMSERRLSPDEPFHRSSFDIIVIHLDGSNRLNLTGQLDSDPGQSQVFPTWSPDSRKLLFYSQGDIFVINVDGTDFRNLTNSPDVVEGDASWSSKGSQIVFTAPKTTGTTFMGTWDYATLLSDQIYIMNADGSNVRRLTDAVPHGFHPTWSPDGSQIAFVSPPYIGNSTPIPSTPTELLPQGWIVVVDSSGGSFRRLPGAGQYETMPRWIRGGSQILFRWREEIYLTMTLDGLNVAELPVAVGHTPNAPLGVGPDSHKYGGSLAISPDEQRLLFWAFDEDFLNGLYMQNLDGSNLRLLVADYYDTGSLSWTISSN